MATVTSGVTLQRTPGPLCLLILLRNKPACPKQTGLWDLQDHGVRARVERLLRGPVFQSYGSKDAVLAGWPFFCLAELPDFEAWASVQRTLELVSDQSGLEWEVVAFGRRTS